MRNRRKCHCGNIMYDPDFSGAPRKHCDKCNQKLNFQRMKKSWRENREKYNKKAREKYWRLKNA